MNATALLEQLQAQVQQQIQTVQQELAPLEQKTLNFKPAPESWSILECLEHLNRYSRYYNEKLSKALAKQTGEVKEKPFSQTWIGKKSLAMMDPAGNKKHKTVKHMNPNNSLLSKSTLTEFQQHLGRLNQLLQQARHADLNRKAIPVEFFKLLKMNIGETFQFIIIHQERHIGQALRVRHLQLQKAA